jgi:DNA polymerase III subunit gamma/tau
MNTLALKYRPRVLSDLVGQEASVKALVNALRRARESGAIHHQAFLFAGVRGTGKTSTARILARSLNCKEGPTPEPCGVCDACVASEQPDRNLDVIEIDAASRASVEDARALREQVQTRPAFCRYRVYIIDEVHMMSRSAFDALLKVLEEPPAHAVFILATTELQDVPDTIKSRVQIYPFRLMPTPVIEGRLKHICEQEGTPFEEGSLRLLAEAGQGSMRDALTILDRVIAAGDGHVLEESVREQLGIVPAVRVQAVLSGLLEGEASSILEQCQALASLGTDWISFWRELMLAFQNRLETEVRRGALPHELVRLARMLHLLLQRERDLRDSSLPQVVVELALITASQMPHLAPLDDLVRQGNGSGSKPVAPSRPVTSSPGPSNAGPSSPGPSSPGPSSPGPSRPNPGTASRAAEPQTPLPGPASQNVPSSTLQPIADPSNLEQLRKVCSEALKLAKGGLPRTLASLPHMASELRVENHALHWFFPLNVRNTVQDLEREQSNPHLLDALRQVLPGVAKIVITFDAESHTRPEDDLRADPIFQRLLQETGGEIVETGRAEP